MAVGTLKPTPDPGGEGRLELVGSVSDQRNAFESHASIGHPPSSLLRGRRQHVLRLRLLVCCISHDISVILGRPYLTPTPFVTLTRQDAYSGHRMSARRP